MLAETREVTAKQPAEIAGGKRALLQDLVIVIRVMKGLTIGRSVHIIRRLAILKRIKRRTIK